MRFCQRFALLLLTMTSFSLAVPAAEDEVQNQASAAPAVQTTHSGDLTLKRFPVVLAQNLTINLFTRDNILPFVIGSGAALAIAPADQEISREMYNHAPEFGDAGDKWGPIITGSITGGFFVGSRFSKSEHFRAFGYTVGQAYMTNAILTQGLKYATHRMRPDGSDSKSFPSGHTSSSFALATVVTHYYGLKWGIPLYAFAGLVGVSRIEHGSHWPSDVIAGAALGYLSGRAAIAGTERELSREKKATWMIAPVVGRDARGVSFNIRY